MKEGRIEKKFVYQEGDDSYKYFLISGMFKEIYNERKVNSIYFDTEDLKNVWDNINGFSDRLKIRLRWYNNISNSEVFIEEKIKKNITTIKKVKSVGTFSNFNELNEFINSKKFIFHKSIIDKKINMKKTIFVSYNRKYFQDTFKKLRVTLDKNIKVYFKYPTKVINIDKNILELKFNPKNFSYCNNFIANNNLDNRNKKYSKYVNSFLELNESGLI